MRRGLVIAACLAGAGCGGSGAGGLANAAGETATLYLALDLASGACTAIAAADARPGPGRIIFRQLPPGSGSIGRPVADDLAETDEHPTHQVATGRMWLATCELTQAQWRRLAGSEPWLEALPFGDLAAFTGDDLPALGLSPAMVIAALQRPLAGGWRLDLPEAAEWERACLAGSTGKFCWGDGYAAADAAPWAVCDPAGDGGGRPAAVASRQANAWGLYDMHGNAWEIVRCGDGGFEARGGAFDQPPLLCRASNHLALEAGGAPWSVGVRLALRR